MGRIIIDSVSDLRRLAQTYLSRSAQPVYFDTESTGLNPRQDKLVAIQLLQEGAPTTVIVDCRRAGPEHYQALRFLTDKRMTLVGHNLKHDLGFLYARGIPIADVRLWDTQLAEQVRHGLGLSGARAANKPMGLAPVYERYRASDPARFSPDLPPELPKEDRAWFWKPPLDTRPAEWAAPFPDDQVTYMGLDVEVLPGIYAAQQAYYGSKGIRKVSDLEMRTLKALVYMEARGIAADWDGWAAFIDSKADEARSLEDTVVAELGWPILLDRVQRYDTANLEYVEWGFGRDTVERVAKLVHAGNAFAAHDATVDAACNFTLYAPEWLAAHQDTLAVQPDESWAVYKKRVLGAFLADHPNPGRPVLDTKLVNIGSPAQLKTALTEVLGYTPESTDADHLEELEAEHPTIERLLEWRKADHFVTSFGDNLLQFVEADGRIHPDYVQIGADTGRMSCARPNWQQIPRKADGIKLRQLVRAGPGCKLLTADFSNIEMRILADYCQDHTLVEWLVDGKDLHTETAKLMFKLPAKWGKKETEATEAFDGVCYRDVAKTINFGLVYGMSPTKLARTLRISRSEAKKLFDVYFGLFPGVVDWLDARRKVVHTKPYSLTRGNRVRYYTKPDPASPDAKSQWAGIERQACNTPIQGTSADITKEACALFYESKWIDPDVVALVAVVHDELVVECPKGLVVGVQPELEAAMDVAQRKYLPTLAALGGAALPRPKATVSDTWQK